MTAATEGTKEEQPSGIVLQPTVRVTVQLAGDVASFDLEWFKSLLVALLVRLLGLPQELVAQWIFLDVISGSIGAHSWPEPICALEKK